MTLLVGTVLGAVAIVLLLPTLSDFLSLARQRSPSPDQEGDGSHDSFVVLIPAHNEESILETTLTSVREATAGLPGSFRAIVIADNCEDQTAMVARAAGVRCLERNEPASPGKPQAIGWGLDALAVERFDAVIVIDADTTVTSTFFQEIRRGGSWLGRAAQGRQRLADAEAGWLTRLGEVFVTGRYDYAFTLKARAALNCPLTGTAMVFGRDVAEAVAWSDLGPAEDMELYAILTRRGVTVTYLPHAVAAIRSESSLAASTPQRRRWSGGRLLAAWRHAPRLATAHSISLAQRLDALAEILCPGPVEHAIIVSTTLAATLLVPAPAGSVLAIALTATLIRPGIYAILGLWRQPSRHLALAAFLFLPLYAVWRLGVMVSAPMVAWTGKWHKTRRVV